MDFLFEKKNKLNVFVPRKYLIKQIPVEEDGTGGDSLGVVEVAVSCSVIDFLLGLITGGLVSFNVLFIKLAGGKEQSSQISGPASNVIKFEQASALKHNCSK